MQAASRRLAPPPTRREVTLWPLVQAVSSPLLSSTCVVVAFKRRTCRCTPLVGDTMYALAGMGSDACVLVEVVPVGLMQSRPPAERPSKVVADQKDRRLGTAGHASPALSRWAASKTEASAIKAKRSLASGFTALPVDEPSETQGVPPSPGDSPATCPLLRLLPSLSDGKSEARAAKSDALSC